MLTNKEIRALSSKQLKGKWAKMALLTLVVIIVTGVPSYFFHKNTIASFLTGVLSGLLFFGIIRVTFNISNKNELDFNEYFKSGRSYGRYFLFSILLSVVTIIISIVFMIVYLVTFGVSLLSNIAVESTQYTLMNEAQVFSAIISSIPIGSLIITILFAVVYMALMILIDMLYSQTSYIIIRDHDDIGVIDSMRYSRKLMKGYKAKLFLLNLSFIGWAILSTLTLGIGFLWLIPYIYVSNANFFLELIKEREELAREMDIVDSYAGDYFRTYENDYEASNGFDVANPSEDLSDVNNKEDNNAENNSEDKKTEEVNGEKGYEKQGDEDLLKSHSTEDLEKED